MWKLASLNCKLFLKISLNSEIYDLFTVSLSDLGAGNRKIKARPSNADMHFRVQDKMQNYSNNLILFKDLDNYIKSPPRNSLIYNFDFTAF